MAAPAPVLESAVSGFGGGFAPVRDLELLLTRAETRVRNQFLAEIRRIRLDIDLDEMARLLEQGRVAEALELSEQVMPRLSSTLEAAWGAAGLSAARRAAEQGLVVDFDQLNARAVTSLQTSRLRRVREFSAETRAAAFEVIEDGVQRGLAPVAQARELRASIGLTRHQARSVVSYRRALERTSAEALARQLRDRRFDGTVRAAVRSREPLSAAQIDRMVDRYRDRAVAFRAQNIAQTESLRAIHEGDQELWQQSVDGGQLNSDEIIGVWRTAADEKVRGSHEFMGGQRRPLGEPFLSGAGNALMHPGDGNAPASEVVRCRCVVAREVNPGGLERLRRAA